MRDHVVKVALFSYWRKNLRIMSHHANSSRRITVREFAAFKRQQRKITVLTAYDFPTAQLVDQCDVEAILVGDSLSMVVQGHETTLPVTVDEMIYHGEMVARAVRHALVIVDLPFPSNHLGVHRAIEIAGEILKRTGCQAIKLEGGAEQAEVISGLVAAGIPVMAHVGLRPQSIHQLGGYRVQRDAERLFHDALAAESSGAFAVVLECIPASVAQSISQQLHIPTIGIGAGVGCDGQVLVIQDLLGLTSGHLPKHVRTYASLRATMEQAVTQFRDDVREGRFPGPAETFE